MKQLKIRLPDAVYEQLQAQAEVATDGNVAELVRMMLVAATVGLPQMPGTDRGPNEAQMVPDRTQMVPPPKACTESPGTDRGPNGTDRYPIGTESVPPASPSSPPITPLSPPVDSLQSADADCVVEDDTADGRELQLTKQNGSSEDPTVRSKAVQIYRHFFGRYPTRDKRRIIVDAVPDEKLSVWRETLEEWKAEEWSPANIEGMLDRFLRRIEGRAKSSRNHAQGNRPPISYDEALSLWERRGRPGGRFPPDGWTSFVGEDGKLWFHVS